MAKQIPPHTASGNGAIADMEQIWHAEALAWALYRNTFIRLTNDAMQTAIINGTDYWGPYAVMDYTAMADPWTYEDHPHVLWLENIGMSKDDIREFWVEGIDPSEVLEGRLAWKEVNLAGSIELAEEMYQNILAELTGVAKIKLTGETISYNGTTPEVDRIAVNPSLYNGHSVATADMNRGGDIDLAFPSIAGGPPNGEYYDMLLAVSYFDGADVQMNINNKPLDDAVKALLLLKQEDMASIIDTVKVSERQVIDGAFDLYFVTSQTTFDASTIDTAMDLADFPHSVTEYISKEVTNDSGITYEEYMEIWKNYFWLFDEGLVEQGNKFFISYNGNLYLNKEVLRTASIGDFQTYIAPAINIHSKMKDLSEWKRFVYAIANFLSNIYSGIYDIIKEIPYFKKKLEHTVQWLVRHGFRGKNFTEEEAIAYMDGIGPKAVGLTISIILIVASWGLATEVSVASMALTFGVTPATMLIIVNSLLIANLALNIGVSAYTSYIGVEDSFDQWKIDEQLKELEELEAELEDAKEEVLETFNIATQGDVSQQEMQNYILYDAMFNEKFEPRLENAEPFAYNGKYNNIIKGA